MAQILYDWLNDEVHLSRRVTSLDEDFKDGYLLGELLYKNKQQDDFSKFLAKGNPDAKINNFCLLEATFRNIGVFFNSRIAYDIMNGKPGVVKTLLYEIRVALDRIAKSAAISSAHQKMVRVVNPSRPRYDKSMAITFENAVRTMVENPNILLMNEATKRFKLKEIEFYKSVTSDHEDDVHDIYDDIQRRKDIEKQKRRHEKDFLDAWEQINVEQWKKNQKVARDRLDLKHKVEKEATKKRQTQQLLSRETARDETLSGIDEFERRLQAEVFPADPG
jgi:hypothetical protein